MCVSLEVQVNVLLFNVLLRREKHPSVCSGMEELPKTSKSTMGYGYNVQIEEQEIVQEYSAVSPKYYCMPC